MPSAGATRQLFSGLVELTPELGVVPDVARSWEVLDGGRKYIFHLRDDVRWSDGVQVTAGDFEYAWKRALDPAYGLLYVANLLYDIKKARAFHQGEMPDPDMVGVHALDGLTLMVELEEPISYFVHLMTSPTLTMPVPRHVVEAHGAAWTELNSIVTNGPFRLVTWERGETMVFERNRDYHGRFTGNLERVEYSLISGQTARLLQMYEGNDLDVLDMDHFSPAEWNRARQRHAGEYVSGPRLGISFIGFDVTRPPFDDPRVRRAFCLATDREALAHVTLRGYVFPATGGFVPPGLAGHSPEIGLPYDPVGARRLLAEADYAGGRGFPAVDCLGRDNPVDDLVREYLRAQWRENLQVEIAWKKMAFRKFVDSVRRETPHIWTMRWEATYPDPDDLLRFDQSFLPGGWQNEVYDRLVEGARRVADQRERIRMYQQADEILVEEAPVLPLYYGRLHMLMKPWVKEYPMSAVDQWFWKDVIIEPH
jgi:oligopeptide transport system substrate-binding protein